ncbi:hypothetical protein P5673_027761 [Acropora cervicornis]|uniref:Tc1-like transposase DDE domain-containing protein n=1 Tax=Acropora cervicornis TaxID=6130 RepID=A0AAD9PY93_ACRCE|nr:hypothetical protein P5673_027761 [Acropora cervicornis]
MRTHMQVIALEIKTYRIVIAVVLGKNILSKDSEFTQPDGNPILEYGDIIVIDNVTLHRFDGGQALAEWLDGFGVTLVYLPLYSPEFSPVELVFNKMKTMLHRYEYRELLRFNIDVAIYRALQEISVSDLREVGDQFSSPWFVFSPLDAVLYLHIGVLKYSIHSHNLRVYGRPANDTLYRLFLWNQWVSVRRTAQSELDFQRVKYSDNFVHRCRWYQVGVRLQKWLVDVESQFLILSFSSLEFMYGGSIPVVSSHIIDMLWRNELRITKVKEAVSHLGNEVDKNQSSTFKESSNCSVRKSQTVPRSA